mmetsp:Transcript_35417/g.65074  ORF Transcript_35417/g.65074 Transcript_35417/m.65074 type:complete len:96 (+) Transcript_35417:43-330(+)
MPTGSVQDAAVEDEATRIKRSINDAIEDELVCPISHELLVDAVTAEDGRLYEKVAIEEHIRQTRERGGGIPSFARDEPAHGLAPCPSIASTQHIE